MMSSSSVMASIPAHPGPAENEPAAIDHGHPQIEPAAGEEITGRGQRGDAEADRHKGMSEPQAGDAVGQHEIDRPERAELARREMTEDDRAKYSECNEQREGREYPDVEGANPFAGVIETRDDERARDPGQIDRGPEIAGAARP